ncbi:MAG: hypothetical protein COW54_07460 [Rhodobacteraceae bacterium CG17_big_fil_post_rev_8_21_14_2_50_63_15]|nr:DUF4174 domain-containing protein [Roseovarius sp.]PIV78832.1 MAG: hypothetical protein COW54_07460 [Rhodobacteraceae bacterium CG17_big_fil_post_rev_8_21_14_2_50_63_15]
MKHVLSLVFTSFIATMSMAQAAVEGADDPIILSDEVVDLDDFLWSKRPVLIFADSPNDPRFIEQMGYITERLSVLEERDVVVITDTDPGQQRDLRRKLRPRGFTLVLVGKDGVIYLRKPVPWQVREITRTIDKLPVRQQELRDRRPGGS